MSRVTIISDVRRSGSATTARASVCVTVVSRSRPGTSLSNVACLPRGATYEATLPNAVEGRGGVFGRRLPRIPGGNTPAPGVILGDKAADVIRGAR